MAFVNRLPGISGICESWTPLAKSYEYTPIVDSIEPVTIYMFRFQPSCHKIIMVSYVKTNKSRRIIIFSLNSSQNNIISGSGEELVWHAAAVKGYPVYDASCSVICATIVNHCSSSKVTRTYYFNISRRRVAIIIKLPRGGPFDKTIKGRVECTSTLHKYFFWTLCICSILA